MNLKKVSLFLLFIMLIILVLAWFSSKQDKQKPGKEKAERQKIVIGGVEDQNNLSSLPDVLQDLSLEYLENNLIEPRQNGKIFCSTESFGTGVEFESRVSYLWVYCQEYLRQDNKLVLGLELSVPLKLFYEDTKAGISILGHNYLPEDQINHKSLESFWGEDLTNKALSLDKQHLIDQTKQKSEEFLK